MRRSKAARTKDIAGGLAGLGAFVMVRVDKHIAHVFHQFSYIATVKDQQLTVFQGNEDKPLTASTTRAAKLGLRRVV